MQYQRKIISIFKSFIQKALVSQIKRMQGSLFEWNKFNSMVSGQSINYNELQSYVDSLSGPVQTIQSPDRKDQFSYFKKRTNQTVQNQGLNDSIGFNPSKTFGGSRARVMFPVKNQFDDFQYKRQQPSNTTTVKQPVQEDYKKLNPTSLLAGVERLAKIFAQNQYKMDLQVQILNGEKNDKPPFV